jgi:hypothetical protein
MVQLPREFAHLREDVERRERRRAALPGERFRVLMGTVAALAALLVCGASFGPNLRLIIASGFAFDLHGGAGTLELWSGLAAFVCVGCWLWVPSGRLPMVWVSVAAFGTAVCFGGLDYVLTRLVVAASVDAPFPYAMGYRPLAVTLASFVGLGACFLLAVRETLRQA